MRQSKGVTYTHLYPALSSAAALPGSAQTPSTPTPFVYVLTLVLFNWNKHPRTHVESKRDSMPSTRILLSAGAACLLGMSGYAYISNKSWFFENIAMPIVARVDPERAHSAAVYIASKGLTPRDLGKDPEILVLY